MGKRTQISLVILGLVIVVVLATVTVGYRLSQGTPSWYQPHAMTDAQRAAAARSADDKVLSLVNRAAEAQAAARRAGRPPAAGENAPAEDPATTVTFSANEINAFFYKWIRLNNWNQQLDRYLADPQIVLQDGQIILAGKASWEGLLDNTIVSIHFSPKLTPDGRLTLAIDSLWAGRLPLPNAVWTSQRSKLISLIDKSLPRLRRSAHIDSGGSADASAVAAIMSRNLLDILQDRAVAPVIFLPVDHQHGYPMKLEKLQIQDNQITFDAMPLNSQDLFDIRQRIEVAD